MNMKNKKSFMKYAGIAVSIAVFCIAVVAFYFSRTAENMGMALQEKVEAESAEGIVQEQEKTLETTVQDIQETSSQNIDNDKKESDDVSSDTAAEEETHTDQERRTASVEPVSTAAKGYQDSKPASSHSQTSAGNEVPGVNNGNGDTSPDNNGDISGNQTGSNVENTEPGGEDVGSGSGTENPDDKPNTDQNPSLGERIVAYATQYVGVTPYFDAWERWDGNGYFNDLYSGTDSGGFVHLIYKEFGIGLPQSTGAYQYSVGREISYDELQPGDIVVYRYGVSVAIYAGSDTIIHCVSQERGTVTDNIMYERPSAYIRVVDE